MPSLENLNQHFKGRSFVIVGIDLREKRSKVKSHVIDNGLTYPNLLDRDGRVSAQYGVNSTPAKFLIGQDGNLIGATKGYRKWDTDEVKALISQLLESKT